MFNTLRQRNGERRVGGVCNEQYLVMVEIDSTTNSMQNTNGEIPDVVGYGDRRRGTYTVGIVGTLRSQYLNSGQGIKHQVSMN